MKAFSKQVCVAALASLLMLMTLAGCGGGGGGGGGGDGSGASGSGGGSTSPPASVTASIGPEGGTVNGPDGVQVVIPAGALDAPTEIGIARRAVGAPSPLPEDYISTAAAPIYEFTPHGIIFNKPVTVRIPASTNAPNAEVLMASPGEDWQATDAVVSGGFAQWQRNSFSWGLVPACAPSNSAPYSSGNPDPYPCSIPSGYASASATPTAAISKVMPNNLGVFSGSAGSWTVNQASTVRLTINYKAAPDCQDPRAKLVRRSPTPQGTLGPVQTLFDGPVGLTPTNLTNPYAVGGGTYLRGVGSASYDVAFSHMDNGTTLFGYSFSCNRPFRPVHTGGDLMTFVTSLPVPTATYTVGGSVGGLSGAGLVLQNNSGNNLAVAANGVFSFATAIGAGAPYAVTVLTQPSGQTCTVQNGSGTANANVSNVAVSCVAVAAGTKAWQGASLLETLDRNALDPKIAFSANGSGMAAWSQVSPSGFADIYVRRYAAATGWGAVEKIQVADSTTNYFSPQVALDDAGNALILFSGSTSSVYPQLLTARYTATSASWGAATALATSAVDSQLAIDSSGNAMVVYSSWNGNYTDILAKRYQASSSAWQAARILSADLGGSDPRVAFDGNGNAIAIWRRLGSNGTVNQEIMGDRYVVGSGWNPQGLPTTIATFAAGASQAHQLAVSAAGNATVVWTQLRPDEPFESVFTSYFAGGSWGTPTALPSSGGRAAMPSVAMDNNSNAIVSWFEEQNGFVNVLATRLLAGVVAPSVRIDNFIVHSSGGSLYGSGGGPKVAMNALGQAVVVWNQALFTWANGYLPDLGWVMGATQIASTTSGGSFSSPQVAIDANGNAIAVWTHSIISPQTGAGISSIWANVFR